MEFKASDYQTRRDLERDLIKKVGKDIQENRELGHTISGTREDCERLLLNDLKEIWGVRCLITDTPTKPKMKKAKSSKPLRKGKPKGHQIKK